MQGVEFGGMGNEAPADNRRGDLFDPIVGKQKRNAIQEGKSVRSRQAIAFRYFRNDERRRDNGIEARLFFEPTPALVLKHGNLGNHARSCRSQTHNRGFDVDRLLPP